ncbi:DUF6525 family protein [Roseibaca sp. Y0-43]|uniref:DUF6525 family protein n=1 Tax=Roseibaca sp. Y0-43 TaxID=2816854 RepID=UPI001D0C7286|nr:DUF6525 family protein [Roseibaca sp. Y0-43]MCC1482218.1 hypothetical protein [Roseibaca sp. Y0-43]
MARSNRGTTSLRVKTRRRNPMQEYDRLPPELRAWLARAALPWRPGSVARVYARAVSRTGDPQRALAQLDAVEARLVAKDAAAVWGAAHPAANAPEMTIADRAGRG